MLDTLPPELILEVLLHVTLSTIVTLRLTSRQWAQFIAAHEAIVYRQAAYRHGFISASDASFDDVLNERHGDLWKRLNDWKDLCYRSVQLDKNWSGKGRSVVRVLHAAGNHVHRIKVDEERQFVITTHRWGGLTVTDLTFPGKMLWSLSNNYTRHYAHCEYSNGYLIFDRPTDEKEVWRLASTFAPSDPPIARAAPPDQSQLAASHTSRRLHSPTSSSGDSDSDSNRGHFRPWALLQIPEQSLAYRFVYPTLLTANSRRAFLYDVPTGKLVQVIENVGMQNVAYVELSARHVIVCGTEAVRIFSRENGSLAFEVPARPAVRRIMSVIYPPVGGDGESLNAVLQPHNISRRQPSPRSLNDWDEYIAVHVSSDGRDMVIMNEQENVLFIQDFERIIRGEVSFKDAALQVRIVDGVHFYLAFEHGRVAVASSNGLYIFHLNAGNIDAPPTTLSPHASFPNITLSSTAPWKSRSFPHEPTVTCLQMSDRRVFFTWNARGRAIPVFDPPQEKHGDRAIASPELEEGEGEVHWEEDVDDEPFGVVQGGGLENEGILGALVGANPLALVPWGNPNEVEVGCVDLSLMPA